MHIVGMQARRIAVRERTLGTRLLCLEARVGVHVGKRGGGVVNGAGDAQVDCIHRRQLGVDFIFE